MSKTALCEFGCGEKTKQEIIKFSDGYSVKVQWTLDLKSFHICEAKTEAEIRGEHGFQDKKLLELNKKHQNDPSLEDLRIKCDFETLKKRVQEKLPFDYYDWLSGFRDLAYAYWFCAKFEDALKAADIHLKNYPHLFGLWQIKWESLIHLKREYEAIKLLEELLNKLLEYKKNPERKTEYDEEGWDTVWEHGYAESVLYEALAKSYERIKNVSKQIEYLEKQIKFLEQQKDKLLENEKSQDVPSDLYARISIRVYEKYGNVLLSIRKNKQASAAFEKANILSEQSKIHKSPEKNNNLKPGSIDEIDEYSQGADIIKNRKKKLHEKIQSFFHFHQGDMTEDDMIAMIEIEFRTLILRKLSKFDNWETEKIPPSVWEEAKKRKRIAEDDPSLLDYGRRVIDYVDFTDYIRIFDHKGNWQKIFLDVFKDKDLFFGNLKNLQKYRNPVSHHRGEKLRAYLTEHGHGHLIQLSNYFMHLMERDKLR